MPLPPSPQAISRWLVRHRAFLVPILLLGLLAVYAGLLHGDVRRTGHAILHADWRWIVLALLCQAGALSLIAWNYRLLLFRLGHTVGWPTLLRAHLRRFAVATLVPFGSPASYVVFTRDLAPAGVSGSDAMSAVLLYSAGGQAAFVIFMIGAVGWLTATATLDLSPFALAIALPITFCWITLPFVALRAGTERIARWRFLPARVRNLMNRLASHQLSPRDLLLPMFFSLAVNALGFGMLLASLHAVGQRPTISGLLLARLAGQLAAHAIPVMHGAGVVELSLVGSLQETGVGLSTATAAAMLFRMAQFWLPLTLGMLFMVNATRFLSGGRAVAARTRSGMGRIGQSAAAGAGYSLRGIGVDARAARGYLLRIARLSISESRE
jgi:uncharacterized protein (TIRG00374 family)